MIFGQHLPAIAALAGPAALLAIVLASVGASGDWAGELTGGGSAGASFSGDVRFPVYTHPGWEASVLLPDSQFRLPTRGCLARPTDIVSTPRFVIFSRLGVTSGPFHIWVQHQCCMG